MFKSNAEHYARNIEEARRVTAQPAIMRRSDDDAEEAAVVIRSKHFVKYVLPAEDAYRFAAQIIDSLAVHRKQAQ